jgi:hypothetical protein
MASPEPDLSTVKARHDVVPQTFILLLVVCPGKVRLALRSERELGQDKTKSGDERLV